jgi:hypothetical protein
VVTAHQGGGASALKLLRAEWGRLVEIFDQDAQGVRKLRFTEYLIGEDIQSDGVDYLLERNPVTEKDALTILHAFDTPAFLSALKQADQNLQLIQPKGLNPNELPPYSALPRNAAIALTFDDVLDDGGNPGEAAYPGTVTAETVRMFTGSLPQINTPYELRILPDPSHGDLINGKFHSTRVILDLAVSVLEAQLFNLPVNPLGLPPSVSVLSPNVALRLPTKVNQAAGQFSILRGLGGAGVSFVGNGPTDPTSPTLDVVRSMRSYGQTSVTGDPNNGFLEDEIPPRVLGSQPIQVTAATPTTTAGEFLVDFTFASAGCATTAQKGDVLDLSAHLAEAVLDGPPPAGGVVSGLRVRVLVGSVSTFGPSVGEFKTTFDPALGHLPDCFVRYGPLPEQAPNVGVKTDASVIVAFSEPMDPVRVQAYDTFEVKYDVPPNPNPMFARVVGRIVPSLDLREYSFEPELFFRHTSGAAEKYLVDLASGPNGVKDLAGNELEFPFPQASFTIASSEPTRNTSGIVLSFDESTLDEDGTGKAKVKGQILFDPSRAIKPRTVTHFSRAVDTSVPVISGMTLTPIGLQTPLSAQGAKMQIIWRYCDVGFSSIDEENHNLDVEGLAWAPWNDFVQLDAFPQFQMSLAHCKYLPDEKLDTGGLPQYPNSGLVVTYNSNLLNATNDPQTVVHPKQEGYSITPLNLAQSPSGKSIYPWPMNFDKPLSQFTYWTWRDTSKLDVGGPLNGGVDLLRYLDLGGAGYKEFYPANKEPTVALPLLMEFRCYPNTTSFAQNLFRTSFAINSSSLPTFRVFTNGTFSGNPFDPDTNTVATGGGTAATPPRDNTVYHGQASFVVRVSRAYTIFLDTGAFNLFAEPVVEPALQFWAPGTQMQFAYRGASALATSNTQTQSTPWLEAQFYNPYGDSYSFLPASGNQACSQCHLLFQAASGCGAPPTNCGFTPTFVNGSTWKPLLSQVNGARYIQARVTFVSNVQTGQTPILSGLGFAFIQ